MPKVKIDHETSLPASDAFSKIKGFFETDPDIRRFDPNLKCEFADNKMEGKATGSQFKADIAVNSKGSGSVINLVIDLPLMLTPFKGKIQQTITQKLSQYLA